MSRITQDHIDGNTPLGANLTADGGTFRVWGPGAVEVHLKLNTPAASFQPGPATLLTKDARRLLGRLRPRRERWRRLPLFRRRVRAARAGSATPTPVSWGWTPPGPIAIASSATRIPTPGTTRVFGRRTSATCHLPVPRRHLLRRQPRRLRPPGHRGRHVPGRPLQAPASPRPRRQRARAAAGRRVRERHEHGLQRRRLLLPRDALRDHRPRPRPLPRPRQSACCTRRASPTSRASTLESQVNQLKAFIDVCHLYGLAVLLDVVYNHAGAARRDKMFDDQSLYFFDFAGRRSPTTTASTSPTTRSRRPGLRLPEGAGAAVPGR